MLAAIIKKINQWKAFKQQLASDRKIVASVVNLAESLIIAVIFVLIFRRIAIQTSLIPTGSMIPTLHIKDRLFVNRFPY